MNYRNKERTRNVLRFFFVIYIIVLFYFLFFSERYGRTIRSTEYRYNLELFREIKRFIQYRELLGTESFIVNIAGNILAFAPFGFLLPVLRKKKHKNTTRNIVVKFIHTIGQLIHITVVSLELSLLIETIQLITKVGCFDVDDLFMNTLGGLLGGIVYVICHAFIERRK